MMLDPVRLRDRLRGVVHGEAREAGPVPPAEPRPDDALERHLGGAWQEGDLGRSFVVRRRLPPDTYHGRARVSDLAEAARAGRDAVALLAANATRPPLLFFDLETTGLSGGAGTHAFLVGCGWFDADGAFVTEQHLLASYAGERGMLGAVAGAFARGGALVSFNGKSFDAPVLETRYGFHRLPFPCAGVPHVDVLHPARRFWSGIDESGCSLGVLERNVLGAGRVDDVGGAEIPSRYFQFIRTGDPGLLSGVLEHNRLDLLSLAGVTATLLSLIAGGAEATDDPREALALGWIYRRGGAVERAAAAFSRAAHLASSGAYPSRRPRPGGDRSQGTVLADALYALAQMARRSRRHADAAAHWQQLLEVPDCPPALSREASEALAIHHEHRARDLTEARRFALKTLEGGTSAAQSDAVRHRLARIERKMVSGRGLFPSSP